MMRSMYSAVSGLKNHIIRQDAIGNNISNVNTPAYKSSSVNFEDILSQTMQGASAATGNRGGINPMQIGLGMGVASISTNFTDGSYQPTGNNANLGIQGQGFFVLSDGAEQLYSRAGDFDFDPNGNYIMNGTGYKVQGWMADEKGNVATTGEPTSLIFHKGMSVPGKVTDQVDFAYNLSKDAKVGSNGMGSITIYDTYGSPHKLTANFTKVADGKWLYQAVGDDGNVLPGTQMGEITFDNSGKVSSIKTLMPPTTPPAAQTINFKSLQFDSTPGSSKKGYFTAYDTNNVMHTYEVQVTNTDTNKWGYSVSEVGAVGVSTLPSGTFEYNPAANTYSVTGTTTFTFPNGAGNVTLDFLSGTEAAPDKGVFAFNQVSPFSQTSTININKMQLDSTADAVQYKEFTVFDDQNTPHVYQMKITTDGANAWKYEATEPGVSDSQALTGSIKYDNTKHPPYVISDLVIKNKNGDTQTIAFTTPDTGSGAYVPDTLSSKGLAMSMDADLTYQPGTSQASVMYIPVNGGPAMSVVLNLKDITQFSSGTNKTNGTTIQALSQTGYAQGTLDSLSVDTSGIVVGKFTNGRQRNLGQVALANFNNANGLLKKGNNIFTTTANSGEAQIGAAGSGGRGVIQPGTLEMSNVDLAQEFTNMITTQRGFQANSKIISVDDEMLQDLVNLKR